MPSFIVEVWSRAFAALGRASVFSLVTALVPSARTARFVDAWVMGHLLLACATLVFAAYFPDGIVALILVLYGIARVFEIAVYQANVVLFDAYRAKRKGQAYALESYRRMVVLLLHNYAEIILWLGSTYTVLADQFVHKWEGGTRTVLGGLYSSFITMTTFGDFDLLPKTRFGAVVLLFHATIGMFMTLLSLARFITLIPPPGTKDRGEREEELESGIR